MHPNTDSSVTSADSIQWETDMKAKLNKIEITAEESATLKAAQTVAEQIWARFRKSNEGYDQRLEMEMQIKEDIHGDPHAWWHVRPMRDMLESGHERTLEAAMAEMHGRKDSELKRKYAQRLRDAAERAEKEARELEAA
jgi:hypothetical protein